MCQRVLQAEREGKHSPGWASCRGPGRVGILEGLVEGPEETRGGAARGRTREEAHVGFNVAPRMPVEKQGQGLRVMVLGQRVHLPSAGSCKAPDSLRVGCGACSCFQSSPRPSRIPGTMSPSLMSCGAPPGAAPSLALWSHVLSPSSHCPYRSDEWVRDYIYE